MVRFVTGPAGIEYTESAVVYAKELSTLIEISVSSIDVPILLMSSLQEIVKAIRTNGKNQFNFLLVYYL